jgi:pimeloyl-ACP methyl ester carboxylesterase
VVRFEDTGGDGPPVLVDEVDGEVFDAQVTELRDVYRLITFASDDDGRLGPWEAARGAFGLLDRLGIERAVLVGRSRGADVALRAGLLHPDRVRALILLDPESLDEDVSDRLDELAMPLVVVHGAEDGDAIGGRAARICATASDCRGVVAVPGGRQASHRSHPGLVNEAVRSFLEGLPA